MLYGKQTGAVPKKGKKEKAKNYSLMNEAKANKKEGTLWKWFSLFIRLRGCPDNSQGFGPCFTGGGIDRYKNMDAGHFISRRYKNTKYDERNVHMQSVHHNRDLSGNLAVYAEKLGPELVEELTRLSKVPAKKMPLWEVEAKIAEYRQKAKDEAYRVGVTL